MKTHHFYIHIPFCRQKCPYCKFALTPVFDEFKKKRYLGYLKKEIITYFDSISGSGKGEQRAISADLEGETVSGTPVFVGEFGESSQDIQKQAVNSMGLGRETVGVRGKKEIGGAKLPSFSLPNAFDTFSHKSTSGMMAKDIGKKIKTLYFGGGTPSTLSQREIREILDCFPLCSLSGAEITLEANPEDITEEYIRGLLELGINRLSIGIQTLNNQSLREIHRSNQENILHALECVSRAGNTDISVNIDMILGLPYTNPGETLSAIRELHECFPFITHTSVYMLEDESYPKHWKANSITEDEMQHEFLTIIEYFSGLGWHHYELSNFGKPGYESIHNRSYWNHSDYRGFGLSASSFEKQRDTGHRWSNASSFVGYYRGDREDDEILTGENLATESLMFGLRNMDGWKITDGHSINTKKLIEDGLITMQDKKITVTKTGIFLLDHIMSELVV